MFRSTWQSCLKVLALVCCLPAAAVTTWFSLDAAATPAAPAIANIPSESSFDESDESSDQTADGAATSQQVSHSIPDRSQFAGSRACLDCHRSEYVSWLRTEHYDNSKSAQRFDAGENTIATKYRKAVGNFDLCHTCHSAPREERFGRRLIETGTSCESCHGAAGGENGWLNRHAAYGPNITSLEQETPQHFADRVAFCDAAGMVRPGRPLAVAKNCYSCHIISDPTLISEDVGHDEEFPDRFSLIPALLGEVRHNFHLDQRHNAETPTLATLRGGQTLDMRKRIYLVVEQFARAEVALNAIATLPGPEGEPPDQDYVDRMKGIFDDAAGLLEGFGEILQDPDDDEVEALTDEEVAPLLGVIEEFDAFDELDEPTRADAANSAQKVAELASAFLSQHDGSKLKALDEEIEVVIDGFEEDQFGKALQP